MMKNGMCWDGETIITKIIINEKILPNVLNKYFVKIFKNWLIFKCEKM